MGEPRFSRYRRHDATIYRTGPVRNRDLAPPPGEPLAGRQIFWKARRQSAGELFWQACLSYHYAQFLWFHDPENREATLSLHRNVTMPANPGPPGWPIFAPSY
jgi:hypothetical protein